MYKVFFNGSTIQIADAGKKSLKDNMAQSVDSENFELINELISKIEMSDKSVNLVLQNSQPQTLWESFKTQFTLIPAAGGLVRKKDGSLLFIKRWGVWDLPKGKIEKHETPEHAALREVEEECGLSGMKIVKQLDSTFHIYRSHYINLPHNLVLKETKWFLMSFDGEQIPVPQTEEDIMEVRWFAIDNLDKVMENTYLSLREFLMKTIPII